MKIPEGTKSILSQEYLKSILDYDSETGVFTRRVCKGSRAPVGIAVGNSGPYGFRTIQIDGRHYGVHNLAWLYVTGCWSNRIKHANGVKHDNRFKNLTEIVPAKAIELTQELLKSLVSYDPKTGAFVWLKTMGFKIKGERAGTYNKKTGRGQIAINRKRYPTSRLAWFYMTGSWPKNEIDHIDRNPSNDTFGNLRDVTKSQNEMNKLARGYHFCATSKKWVARYVIRGKVTHVGYFNTEQQAKTAYKEAIAKLPEIEFMKVRLEA